MKINDLLDEIVAKEESQVKAILIFDLEAGQTRFTNTRLKSSDQELYNTLFGKGGIAKATIKLKTLQGIPDALNILGEETKYGSLENTIFFLKEVIMLVYFVKFKSPYCICFIAQPSASFGELLLEGDDENKKIAEAMKQLFEEKMKGG